MRSGLDPGCWTHETLDPEDLRAPRITAELREENVEAVNHKRVARIMRASGIEGVRLRRRHRTTVPDPAAAKAPDLIGRDFTADKPNTKYVEDAAPAFFGVPLVLHSPRRSTALAPPNR